MKKLKNILTSSKLLIVCAIVSIFLFLASDLPYFFIEDYQLYKFDALVQLFNCIGIIALLVAFKKGEINIQKALLGGLLYSSAIGTFGYFVDYLDYYAAGFDVTFELILFIAYSIGDIGILVSHLVLQSDHKGSMKAIYFIYFFVALLIAGDICDCARIFSTEYSYSNFYILNNIGCAFFDLMILCIEVRIQTYKQIRFDAMKLGEWTLENKAEAKKLFTL